MLPQWLAGGNSRHTRDFLDIPNKEGGLTQTLNSLSGANFSQESESEIRFSVSVVVGL